MEAKIVTFSISKGGCAKSTSSSVIAYLLSKESKVLAVDMDNQGNLTSLLTGEYNLAEIFEEKTVLEAIMDGDARKYIIQINENLHLLPSNDYLAILSRTIQREGLGLDSLEKALKPVMEDYDWIIIDTPPALNDQTILPLNVKSNSGSYLVIPFNATKFSFYAIEKILEIVALSRTKNNPGIETLGILFNNVDVRSKEYNLMNRSIEEQYPNLKFETIIHNRAAIRRLDLFGLNESNPEYEKALEYYEQFVEEMKERVRKNQQAKKQ